MNKIEFEKLLDKNRYQVFLFSSPIPFPFNFAVHTWIVTSKKGKLDRWEVWEFKNMTYKSKGHVNKNLSKPLTGMNKFLFIKRYKSESKLIGHIKGDKSSIAKKMIDFIEKNYSKYIYKDEYRYIPGPNSNTFIQQIIKEFPSSKFKLPWNALGKNYKI